MFVASFMLRLVQVTQAIFCLVSMILTSLFALSLSGVTVDTLPDQEGWGKAVFLAVLFILIGCCIDIGKYLFWSQRQRSRYYGMLSLVLMIFSWLASCAFLVTSEHDLVRESQVRSDQYIALQLRIESTRQAIAFHERLLEKRLGSAYHSQWKESETDLETIASLKSTLADLTEDSSNVGLETAAQAVPTTRFFAGVGQVLNIDPQVVSVMGYGILSLLLELSTLGMIGLARTLKSDLGGDYDVQGETETVIQNSEHEIEVKQKVAQLTSDILQSRIPPVLRKIKAAHYDLDLDVVRQVLRNLFDAGILEQDKRNSYKLGDQFQNIAS
ncbi:MAG: hypothetical protein CL693_00630 [Cellvibrionaceae bacterium]|nr:hypothetical protein [Cellvibrionaceae bacterium]|tara:strand:- start:211 stop:1194 length:984 start_codon:yes stop_codon:yes gene_type:complete